MLVYFDYELLTDQGSTYVRWGRKQCAVVNTDLVYTGNIDELVNNLSFFYFSREFDLLND